MSKETLPIRIFPSEKLLRSISPHLETTLEEGNWRVQTPEDFFMDAINYHQEKQGDTLFHWVRDYTSMRGELPPDISGEMEVPYVLFLFFNAGYKKAEKIFAAIPDANFEGWLEDRVLSYIATLEPKPMRGDDIHLDNPMNPSLFSGPNFG